MNWGEAYLEHYEGFFQSEAHSRWVARADGPAIQVLAFDRVFSGCRVFTTLGITHCRERLGTTVEVFAAADSAWDRVPDVLGRACLYLATEGNGFARGHAMSGIENIDPEFAQKFGFSALYFTAPQGLPEAFESLRLGAEVGEVCGAMFITPPEFAALQKFGPAAFERCLAHQKVDPFAIRRESAVFRPA